MPRHTDRKKALEIYDTVANATNAILTGVEKATEQIASQLNDPKVKEDVAAISEAVRTVRKVGNVAKNNKKAIMKKRYLHKGSNNLPKMMSQPSKIQYLYELDNEAFVEEFRMSKSSFFKLIDLIKDDSEYQPKGNKPQVDIRLQVAIVLERLGVDGNGASFSRLARRSGVGSKLLKLDSNKNT